MYPPLQILPFMSLLKFKYPPDIVSKHAVTMASTMVSHFIHSQIRETKMSNEVQY